MAKSAPRTVRDLRIAAMAGDVHACRALLRRHGEAGLAKEVRAGRPHSRRVRRMLDALTAGTNTEWEHVEADGTITNDLHEDDAMPFRRSD
jgi:predicted LPLAT superfamily acyltransferase